MTSPKRPRVAAIGLDSSDAKSISGLCGVLREADTLEEYLKQHSWTETDILVASDLEGVRVSRGVHLLMLGHTYIDWPDKYESYRSNALHYVHTNPTNTERELSVTPDCLPIYESLAAELSRNLALDQDPPSTFETSRQIKRVLIKTTSGYPVALRIVLPAVSSVPGIGGISPIALFLPEVSNLMDWFRAFLLELHELDPSRVPQVPPDLALHSDWYTPRQRALADRIRQIDSEFDRLTEEKDRLLTELDEEGLKADSGIRRVLWVDGADLVSAAREVLADLGFVVRDMDEEKHPAEPKREDLRLKLDRLPGWEAIVEVKGYLNGTRTNDARQIREHRDRYIREEGRTPDLTVWLSNPYRNVNPSSRPFPDPNVEQSAELIDAVHVLSSDLYRQWALVTAGILDATVVIESLVNAAPGLWTPPNTESSN